MLRPHYGCKTKGSFPGGWYAHHRRRARGDAASRPRRHRRAARAERQGHLGACLRTGGPGALAGGRGSPAHHRDGHPSRTGPSGRLPPAADRAAGRRAGHLGPHARPLAAPRYGWPSRCGRAAGAERVHRSAVPGDLPGGCGGQPGSDRPQPAHPRADLRHAADHHGPRTWRPAAVSAPGSALRVPAVCRLPGRPPAHRGNPRTAQRDRGAAQGARAAAIHPRRTGRVDTAGRPGGRLPGCAGTRRCAARRCSRGPAHRHYRRPRTRQRPAPARGTAAGGRRDSGRTAAGALDAATATKRLALAGFGDDPEVVLLAVRTSGAVSDAALDQAWSDLGISHLLLQQRQLFALVPAAADALEMVAASPGIRAGCSRPFRVRAGFASARRESLWSLQRALDRGLSLVAFPEGDHDIIWLPADARALRDAAERVLGSLRAYDQRRGTELIASLRTWLEHGRSITAAAQALSVHKHTLAYRLKRAEEITGRDLAAVPDLVDIWLALRANEITSEDDGESAP